MHPDTWQLLDQEFSEYPQTRARAANEQEIADAEQQLGCAFPPDFREFIRRYGGGIVGSLRIYGVLTAEWMGDAETLIEQNQAFRAGDWPGIRQVLVFSDDGSGNPIGFCPDGRIWKSDHNAACVYDWQADTFEEFLHRRCLGLPPESWSDDLYVDYAKMALAQSELLTQLGVKGRLATCERDTIWISTAWDALDESNIVLKAVRADAPSLNEWHLAPQTRPDPQPDDHYVELRSLWRKRPALVKVLALPEGYEAYFSGEELKTLLDPSGRRCL